MLFRHILLTRFNVRLPEHQHGNEEWMEHRLLLFERFCLPSVRSQTCKNFDWLLFFDTSTSARWRERIERLVGDVPYRAVYLDGPFTQDGVRDAVRPLLDGYEYAMTSRLDNDDAICRDFVEVLHGRFASQDYEFLNFTNGFVWHRGRVYRSRQFSNAFVTLVERNFKFSTAFCGNHMRIATLGRVQQIEHPAAWLQVVHDRNLSNFVHGTPCPIEEIRGFEIAAQEP